MFSVPAHWVPLAVPPEKFITERQETHYAAQVVASLGAALLPAHADGSHRALFWQSPHILVGQEVKPGKTLRAALNLVDFELQLWGHTPQGYAVQDRFALAGHKLDAAFDWLEAATESYLDRTLDKPLPRLKDLPWKMPGKALEMGAIFMSPNEQFKELGHWLNNAHALLTQVAHEHPMNAGHLYCWPQSLALEFVFDQAHRSLKVGFSPGDDAIREPYFYLKPQPDLAVDELKDLELGKVQRLGWKGAYLTASEVLAASDTDGQVQAGLIGRFLHETMHQLSWFA